jgi:outer membrane biosynthesis protein TonB
LIARLLAAEQPAEATPAAAAPAEEQPTTTVAAASEEPTEAAPTPAVPAATTTEEAPAPAAVAKPELTAEEKAERARVEEEKRKARSARFGVSAPSNEKKGEGKGEEELKKRAERFGLAKEGAKDGQDKVRLGRLSRARDAVGRYRKLTRMYLQVPRCSGSRVG